MANGDMLPLWHPCRNLRVDSLGMLWDYKIGGAIRKPPSLLMMELKSSHTVAALERMQFSATGAEVTHVDLKSDITTGKQQLFLERWHLELKRTVGNW